MLRDGPFRIVDSWFLVLEMMYLVFDVYGIESSPWALSLICFRLVLMSVVGFIPKECGFRVDEIVLQYGTRRKGE
jgi:hypothetical protein